MRARMIMTMLSVAALLTFSVTSALAFSNAYQAKDNLSGKYEGVAKSEQMGDIPLTVEIKNDAGKLSGKIDSPQGPAAITGGTFDNGKVVMKFDAGGNEGTVTAMLEGDKITGSSESAQGAVPLSKGTWTANKLSFSMDTPNGSIGMTATIKDGKLV